MYKKSQVGEKNDKPNTYKVSDNHVQDYNI